MARRQLESDRRVAECQRVAFGDDEVSPRSPISQIGLDHPPVLLCGTEAGIGMPVLQLARAAVMIPMALHDDDDFDIRDVEAQRAHVFHEVIRVWAAV